MAAAMVASDVPRFELVNSDPRNRFEWTIRIPSLIAHLAKWQSFLSREMAAVRLLGSGMRPFRSAETRMRNALWLRTIPHPPKVRPRSHGDKLVCLTSSHWCRDGPSREMVCPTTGAGKWFATWVLRPRRLPGAPLTSCITSGGTSDRAYVCLAHPVKGAILFARRRIARRHIARWRAKSLRAYRWPNLDFRALVAGSATAGARLLPVGQRYVCGARSRAFVTRISRTRGCPTCITTRLALPARARSQHSVRAH